MDIPSPYVWSFEVSLQAGYFHHPGMADGIFLLAVLGVGIAVLQLHYLTGPLVEEFIGLTDDFDDFTRKTLTYHSLSYVGVKGGRYPALSYGGIPFPGVLRLDQFCLAG